MKENDRIDITDGLLIAFINGELDAVKEKQVSDWINRSEENLKHFEMIRKAWEVTGEIEPKPVVVDTDLAWKNVFGQINGETEKVIPITPRSNRKIYWSIAAMVVVLLGVFSLLKMGAGGPENIEVVAQNSGLVDQLSDGSTVTLNANTSIVYPETFSENERRVTLKGEAFFEIERNEEKPFIIDLPEQAYVKVLGTSFNIKAVKGDSTMEVFVKTGKVEFGTDNKKIILVKGEKGVMDLKSGNIYKKTSVTTGAKEMYWIEEELRFDGIPLSEVLAILNEVFDEEVMLSCPELEGQRQRSVHRGESLEDILEVVADSQGLSVEENNDNGKKFILNCNDL